MKISVLVAVYNSKKYLKECLDSLLSQSLRDIEIICINDGSTDNSQKILDEYAARDTRIRLLSQENAGASAARNSGLEIAQGEYICQVDSDDFLSSDCLEKAYSYAVRKNLDATVFKLIFFGSNLSFANLYSDDIFTGAEATKLSILGKISGLAIFRSNIIKGIRYDTDTMNGDELSTRKFFLACNWVGFSEGEYHYRQHAESVTKKFSIKHFDTLETNIMLRDLLKSNNFYDDVKSEFEIQIFGAFVASTLLFLNNSRKFSAEEKKQIKSRLKKSYLLFDREYLKTLSLSDPFAKRTVLNLAIRSSSFERLIALLKPIAFLAKSKI